MVWEDTEVSASAGDKTELKANAHTYTHAPFCVSMAWADRFMARPRESSTRFLSAVDIFELELEPRARLPVSEGVSVLCTLGQQNGHSAKGGAWWTNGRQRRNLAMQPSHHSVRPVHARGLICFYARLIGTSVKFNLDRKKNYENGSDGLPGRCVHNDKYVRVRFAHN